MFSNVINCGSLNLQVSSEHPIHFYFSVNDMNTIHTYTHPHTILFALETVIQKIFADDHKPKAFRYLSKRTLGDTHNTIYCNNVLPD